MSMKSLSEDGYGLTLFNDNNWKNIVDFLKNTTTNYTDEQKKANELLAKYAEILGITETPNYFESEYFE